MVEKEHDTKHSENNGINKLRRNPWMVSTVVVSLVLIVVVIFGFTSGFGGVSKSTAGDNLVKFVASQGESATIVSAEKQGQLYNIVMNIQGQQVPVYVTLDGKYAITNPIPLTSDATATATNTNTNTASTTTGDVSNVKIDSTTPVLGSANAKVTVIEFTDFSCPFCAAASGDNKALIDYMKGRSPSWEPVVTNLIKDYVDTGKVRLVMKYSFGHSGGHPAQLVAWCLNDQGLYWKFAPKAFAAYDLNAQTQAVEDLNKMKDIAKSVGADMTKLQSCLDSKKYDSRFDIEQAEGTQAGAQGTPAFFVNGKLVSGAVPYSQFKATVDAALAA